MTSAQHVANRILTLGIFSDHRSDCFRVGGRVVQDGQYAGLDDARGNYFYIVSEDVQRIARSTTTSRGLDLTERVSIVAQVRCKDPRALLILLIQAAEVPAVSASYDAQKIMAEECKNTRDTDMAIVKIVADLNTTVPEQDCQALLEECKCCDDAEVPD